MENFVRIDKRHRRVTIRAQGQWTLALAEQWHRDMLNVRDWALETGAPITILADLDGLILHTQEVAQRIEESIVIMRQFPIDQYILIVPSYLMRMQCRRLLENVKHCYAETIDAARRQLRWPAQYDVVAA